MALSTLTPPALISPSVTPFPPLIKGSGVDVSFFINFVAEASLLDRSFPRVFPFLLKIVHSSTPAFLTSRSLLFLSLLAKACMLLSASASIVTMLSTSGDWTNKGRSILVDPPEFASKSAFFMSSSFSASLMTVTPAIVSVPRSDNESIEVVARADLPSMVSVKSISTVPSA